MRRFCTMTLFLTLLMLMGCQEGIEARRSDDGGGGGGGGGATFVLSGPWVGTLNTVLSFRDSAGVNRTNWNMVALITSDRRMHLADPNNFLQMVGTVNLNLSGTNGTGDLKFYFGDSVHPTYEDVKIEFSVSNNTNTIQSQIFTPNGNSFGSVNLGRDNQPTPNLVGNWFSQDSVTGTEWNFTFRDNETFVGTWNDCSAQGSYADVGRIYQVSMNVSCGAGLSRTYQGLAFVHLVNSLPALQMYAVNNTTKHALGIRLFEN